MKVAGVGSVGTLCSVAHFIAVDDEPFFLLPRTRLAPGDAAMIAGYMGASEIFDDAIAEFAVEYADQTR